MNIVAKMETCIGNNCLTSRFSKRVVQPIKIILYKIQSIRFILCLFQLNINTYYLAYIVKYLFFQLKMDVFRFHLNHVSCIVSCVMCISHQNLMPTRIMLEDLIVRKLFLSKNCAIFILRGV